MDPLTGLSDAELLLEMAELLLGTDADGSVPGRRPVDGSIYKVVVAEGQSGAAVVTEDGPEAIDEASRETAVSDGATPPKLRAKVLARDGHRCRSCGTTRSLHAHHVKWRVHGGETRLANLVTLCAKCHGMVHEGLLQVAPGATLGESVGFEFRDRNGRARDRFGELELSMGSVRPLSECEGAVATG